MHHRAQQFDEFKRIAQPLTHRIVSVQKALGHPPYDGVKCIISYAILKFFRHHGEYMNRFENPNYVPGGDELSRAERKLTQDINQAEHLLRTGFAELSLSLFDRIDVVEDYLNSSEGSILKQRPVLDAIYSFNEHREYYSQLFCDATCNASGDDIIRALAELNERVIQTESLLQIYKDKEDDTTDDEDFNYNPYEDYEGDSFDNLPSIIPPPNILRRYG